MALLQLNGMGLLGTDDPRVFADIPTDSPIYLATRWMKERGISVGCGNNNYCPDDSVTRGQMALFLYRMGTGGVTAPINVNSGTNTSDIPGTSFGDFISRNKLLLAGVAGIVVLLSMGGRR